MLELHPMDELIDWINSELGSRGWTYADIARHGGISKSMISRVVSGQSKPGPDFCLAVARAFQVRPEKVFRLAGILPPLAQVVDNEEELIALFRMLPGRERDLILVQLRALAGQLDPPITSTDPL